MPGEARRERRWLDDALECTIEKDAVPDIIDLWQAALNGGIPAEWERRFRNADRRRRGLEKLPDGRRVTNRGFWKGA